MSIKIEIYQYLQTIPKGKVVSYKTIAEKFGIHPRYVGRIMNQNKEPDIYPCYKVIKSDGQLGGYAFGTEEKIQRLQKNGIEMSNGKIYQKYFWE
jgi:methylated-DNA-[protein]-cysteine S-methyltransferase